MVAMRVIELRAAQTNLDIGHASVIGDARNQCAVLGLDGYRAGIGNRVAEEIRRKLVVLAGIMTQRGESAIQLRGHGAEKRR